MSILCFAYPFFTIFILFGLAGTVYTLRNILRTRSTSAWPKTRATLLNCGIRGGSAADKDPREVVVEYTYTVNGKTYTGKGLRPSYRVDGEKGQRLYERLKTCKVVLARYNPNDPGEAYLLSGDFTEEWAAFFAMLLFLAGGILFMLGFHFHIAGSADYASALTIIE